MTLPRLPILALLVFAGAATAPADPPAPAPAGGPELIQKIRRELSGPPTEDSKVHAGVPAGEIIEGAVTDPKIYPGTVNNFRVYVPAQYDPARPACLYFRLDGIGKDETVVFDNLIAKGEMPVTIAVGLASGTVWKTPGQAAYRWNRSYEFDSTNRLFPDFVLNSVLPKVESLTTRDGRPIHLSHAAADRAVSGGSTGGIGSFTLAWERPDSFSRVYSIIGTFVAMRGGNDYPALVRKTDPKPIRLFLEDGTKDAWNPLFGTWFMANENMEAALAFSGYDVQHAWGVHGHDGGPGNVILPDVMRWLWRGWPAAVEAGTSQNDMLLSLLRPGEDWQRVAGDFGSAQALATSPGGAVYFSDATRRALWRIGADGTPQEYRKDIPGVSAEAFGPDGLLYAAEPDATKIVAFDAHGAERTVTEGIRAGHLLVNSRNELYAAEPGRHSDDPSNLWRIKPGGNRQLLDGSLLAVAGIALAPDQSLLFAAERGGNRVYSFVSTGEGALADKEPNYWLHPADLPHSGGNGDLAVDRNGDLFVATPLGIQVCDRNGRVRAILWVPFPGGAIEGICWGGLGFDTLYATDGVHLFRRRLNIPGYPPWSAPAVLPPWNAG